MKKFYCFHCQQNIEPIGFWKMRFCPHCHRYVTDKGEGFYKVCDSCGANLPADAAKCLKCGHYMEMENTMEQYGFNTYVFENQWLGWLLIAIALFLAIIVAIGVLYISFYAVAAVFIVALAAFLFNAIRAWLHL